MNPTTSQTLLSPSVLLSLLLCCVLSVVPAGALSGEGVVYTSNYPLYFFASRIAGDDLDVVFPAPANVDPAYWRPDAETLLGYQQADLILLNGAGFEQWVQQTALPRSRLVDTTTGLEDRLIAEDAGGTAHVHGPEGAHVHAAATAFTTWLDLSLARAQASAAMEAMSARWPHLADAFAERHAVLDTKLAELDTSLREASMAYAGKPILASHPVYQYLARRYVLDVRSLHWEPDIHPDELAWQSFEDLLAQTPAKLMLWEDEPTPETRARLAELGIEVLVFPTLSNRPTSGDFRTVMQSTASRLVAISESPTGSLRQGMDR